MSCNTFGSAPCGQLERICTWQQDEFENNFTYTVKGKCGDIAELLITNQDYNNKILITSLHASYDVDGTNGLFQLFCGESLIWCARTMGAHLTINFPYFLSGKKGENMLLQLSGKSGIQGIISVTGLLKKEC